MTDEAEEPVSRSESRLIGRAVREGWNIPPGVMEEIPAIMARELVHATPMRDRERAARILLELNKQNIALETEPKQSTTQINVGVNIGANERRKRLSAIASRFGINFVPEVSATEPADSDPAAVVRVEVTDENADGT